jgi:transcriptional regulator
MHPDPAFRKSSREEDVDFARDRSFGSLSMNGEEGPLLAHIPFQLSPDGNRLEAHLARSNQIARALRKKGPMAAVLAVSGGDGYISPDWYGVDDQVPTWNYLAVHLRGPLRLLPDSELRGILQRLSASMESRLAPKTPWTMDKMDGDTLTGMMRSIVPIAMDVEVIESTWKMTQNKADDVRERAASALSRSGFGMNWRWIAEKMKNPPGR